MWFSEEIGNLNLLAFWGTPGLCYIYRPLTRLEVFLGLQVNALHFRCSCTIPP